MQVNGRGYDAGMGEDAALPCANCGAQNPAAARFCNQCGARLDVAPAPGYTPPHLRGTLAQTATVHGERKRVTVLFADIKGSTRLAEQAGAELWHQVLDRFFGILARVIHAYDGTINQYTGDGVMALFGAPRALEDHAGHAAHAALQMQQEVRRYADELRLAHGLNLSMRVGLNSGEVVVGRIGDDLRQDYTAQGPTVNLAARIENICEPGHVYVGCDTARLLEAAFRLRSLGATQIPGLGQAVEVFELEGPKAGLHTRLQRSLARSGSPFIGRDDELARLSAVLDLARSGRGQVVSVVGNAGIGKSRLCHEFVSACEREGIAVYRSSGVPYASRLPMFPFRELLRGKLGVPADASPAEARRWIAGALLLESPDNAALLPPLFEFLGIAESAERTPDVAALQQQHMLDELAQYLPCDDGGPSILLIEDLHFLDRASEEFLPRLCRAVREHACLLLLNHRPDYPSEWLQPLIDESLPLTALRRDQLQRLAQTLLGDDPSVADAAGVIVERAAGNPYFVEEAVQALAEGGWLQGRPRAWTLVRPVEEWPVPDSVQALLAARVDRLPDPLRARLHAAAVIGMEFEPHLLAVIGDGVPEPDVTALQELGFLHEREDGTVSFCHPLVQEVAYRGQLEARRRAMHATLAQHLEQHCGGSAARPGPEALAVALHWQRAGEWQRAGQWNLIALRWTELDMATALDQVRRAIDNFDRADGGSEALLGRIAARSALIRLSQFAAIRSDEVARAYAEARELARICGDVGADAELQISYGNELMRLGQVDAAARTHELAMAQCFEHGRADLINRFRLAVLLSFNAAGRPRRIVELLDAAGADWRQRAVDEENYMSRGFYGLMLAWMGRLEEGARDVETVLDYARAHGRTASWLYASSVDLHLLRGDYERALPLTQIGLEQAEKHGSPFFRAVALRGHALALSYHGRHDEALSLLHEALPLVAAGAPAHQFEANVLATQAMVLLAAGDESAAEAAGRRARERALAAGSRIWEMNAWLVWLQLPATPARREEARTGLARFVELIENSGAEGFRPWWWLAQAHWTAQAPQQAALRARARAAFAAIGAQAHVQRLDRAAAAASRGDSPAMLS
jgi:class 3 adenylate cyclase/tetratricopeptide (TPR) repeat protein